MSAATVAQQFASQANTALNAGSNLLQFGQYGKGVYQAVNVGIRRAELVHQQTLRFINETSGLEAGARSATAGLYGLGVDELRSQLTSSISAARDSGLSSLQEHSTHANALTNAQVNNAQYQDAASKNQSTNAMAIGGALGGVIGSIGALVYQSTKVGKTDDLPHFETMGSTELPSQTVSVNMNNGYQGGQRVNNSSVETTNVINNQVEKANNTLKESNALTNGQGKSGEDPLATKAKNDAEAYMTKEGILPQSNNVHNKNTWSESNQSQSVPSSAKALPPQHSTNNVAEKNTWSDTDSSSKIEKQLYHPNTDLDSQPSTSASVSHEIAPQ